MTTTDRLRDALIANGCDSGDGTYIHCSMEKVLAAIVPALAASEASPIEIVVTDEMVELAARAIEGRTLRNQVQRHDTSNPYCPCPTCQARAALQAALTTRSDEGWRYVPLEPTEAMIENAFAVCGYDNGMNWSDGLKNHYRAMLAAAPSPPDREKP